MIVHPPESDLVLPKHATGITGFDFIAQGGLPKGRTTLVAGTAGSAKTVFAAQFLAEGIKQHGEAGVFVTFEEAALDIRRNMRSLHWPIEQWEADGRWAFVDASPVPADAGPVIGEFDLGGLLARIENAVRRTGARRVSMDSVATIFARFEDHATVRSELLRITQALKTMGVTSIITAERTQEYGDIARFGVEEFVTDNVIILRNVLEVERRRRTIEILKFRGAPHGKGEYPFTIIPGDGLVVIPLSAIELQQHSSDVRITSGNVELDRMCGGGFFRDSVILVSGATGCGKTLMTAEFLNGGVQNGERCLVFAFEESREQLIRNARGWNVDFERAEQSGLLRLSCEYPEVMGLEDHLIRLKAEIEAFGPQRIAVDSLSALERVSSQRGFREFVIGLTSFIKHRQVAGLFTSTTPTLLGGDSVTEAHISSITDSIILLRYVEIFGEMRRGATVLKMRGSMHEKQIREFTIDDRGLHMGRAFSHVQGILSGRPRQVSASEIDRLGTLFQDE